MARFMCSAPTSKHCLVVAGTYYLIKALLLGLLVGDNGRVEVLIPSPKLQISRGMSSRCRWERPRLWKDWGSAAQVWAQESMLKDVGSTEYAESSTKSRMPRSGFDKVVLSVQVLPLRIPERTRIRVARAKLLPRPLG